MKLIDNIARMSTLASMIRKEGKTIGFVPTMGYLHDGHLSLVKAATKHTDVVIMSIFVNPIQFGPKEDFGRYPRDLKRDEALAAEAGVDILFCPSQAEMYPEGYSTYVNVEGLTDVLCGYHRPGHFRGVTTVVAKLLHIAKPDVAYFGQKDAQQAIIIKKMAKDLNFHVEVRMLPIAREKDGLAMSSRNVYLTAEERKDSLVLYQAVRKAESMMADGQKDTAAIIKGMKEIISQKPSVRIEYISAVDTNDLKDVKTVSGETLIAIAAQVGKTRLLDNTIIYPSGAKASRAGQKNKRTK